MNWRFLVIEDNEDTARQLEEAIPEFVDAPSTAESEIVTTFAEAERRMKNERYDFLILDLKDDSDDDDENAVGLTIFEALKATRFTPVIFYTGLAHKVQHLQTNFIRVVEKTEAIGRVKEEVTKIIATQLPALARKLEEIQRQYMWDFVSNHWQEFQKPHEQADLAYLLARRLALSLQDESRKLAQGVAADAVAAEPANAHPMQLYVRPPIGNTRLAGDIVRSEDRYWLILTPSCDFVQKDRLHHILLAECLPLSAQAEFTAWRDNQTAQTEGVLKALIGDARQKAQSERYKFLPGTIFIPDLVVDFQKLRAITPEEFVAFEVIASLDSPYAEAMLSRFSRYFGRLGTPDVDKQVVLDRLRAQLADGAALLP